MNRKKKKKPHPPWWDLPWTKCSVLHSEDTSYLVHFPKWGTPLIVAFGPRCWGLHDPLAFAEAGFRIPVFPMKKPLPEQTKTPSQAALVDDLVESHCLLAEMLTCTAYDGDVPGSRKTSTLLIFAQDGMWKACLSDRQEGRALWVTSRTFHELIDVLESSLGDSSAVWREDRNQGAQQATRQKPQK